MPTPILIAALILCIAAAFYLMDTQQAQAWLATPLRDASLRDVAVLLGAAVLLSR